MSRREYTVSATIIGARTGLPSMDAPSTIAVMDGIVYPADVKVHPSDGNTWCTGDEEWKYSKSNHMVARTNKVPWRTIRTFAGYCAGVHTIDFSSVGWGTACYIGIVPATYGNWHGQFGNSGNMRICGPGGNLYVNDKLLIKLGPFVRGMRLRLVLNFDAKTVEIWYNEDRKGEYTFDQLNFPLTRPGGSKVPMAYYPALCSSQSNTSLIIDSKWNTSSSSPATPSVPSSAAAESKSVPATATTMSSIIEASLRDRITELDAANRSMAIERKEQQRSHDTIIARLTRDMTTLVADKEDAQNRITDLSQKLSASNASLTKALVEVKRLASMPAPAKAGSSSSSSSSSATISSMPSSLEFKGGRATITRVKRTSGDDWDTIFTSWKATLKNNISDYVGRQHIDNGYAIGFYLEEIHRVDNPILKARYDITKARLKYEDAINDMMNPPPPSSSSVPSPSPSISSVPSNTSLSREVWAFHGTRPTVIEPICNNGLLRVGHPLNPSVPTDEGWFGTPTDGVYVSRHCDYALKYSNQLKALDIGESCRVIMLRALPGRSKLVPTQSPGNPFLPRIPGHVAVCFIGLKPTVGFHSHTSSLGNTLPHHEESLHVRIIGSEWYLFDESQCYPAYVLTIRAFKDPRIKPDDD